MITTPKAAIAALRSALADVDNDVAAGRALGDVASRFLPVVGTQWESFRFSAEKLLEKRFGDRTQTMVWTILDPYFGLVAGTGNQCRVKTTEGIVPGHGPVRQAGCVRFHLRHAR